jgi:hypothetical protein
LCVCTHIPSAIRVVAKWVACNSTPTHHHRSHWKRVSTNCHAVRRLSLWRRSICPQCVYTVSFFWGEPDVS